MRFVSFLSLFIFIVLVTGCKKEQQKQTEQVIEGMSEKTSSTTLPSFSNDYLVSVYETQELIKMDGDNIDLRKKYCTQSYNQEQQLFVSMGIARLRNPETGQPIPQYLAERVAKLDAVRWAGYGEKWLKNNYQPPFGKIEIQTSRPVELINTAKVGDSLFVFVGTRFSVQ
jgi:hypothetical protein